MEIDPRSRMSRMEIDPRSRMEIDPPQNVDQIPINSGNVPDSSGPQKPSWKDLMDLLSQLLPMPNFPNLCSQLR